MVFYKVDENQFTQSADMKKINFHQGCHAPRRARLMQSALRRPLGPVKRAFGTQSSCNGRTPDPQAYREYPRYVRSNADSR